MIQKEPVVGHRIRRLEGSFAWIGHRFLRDGFFASLTHDELVLYLFLVLVGDRQGLSYYSFDKICTLTGMDTDDYITARNALMDKDLIAFDGRLFQVLSLPSSVHQALPSPILPKQGMIRRDPASLLGLLSDQFGKLDRK